MNIDPKTMADMVRDILAGSCEPEQDTRDPHIARTILRDAFALILNRHHFEPGQFIRKKRGLSDGSVLGHGEDVIFVRYMTTNDVFTRDTRTDRVPSSVQRAASATDCVIAAVVDDGAVAEFLACSDYYEPAPLLVGTIDDNVED